MSNIVEFTRRPDSGGPGGPASPPPGPPEPGDEARSFDIWWLVGLLRRRLRLVVAIVVLLPTLAVLWTSTLPPIYAAGLRLVIEGDKSGLDIGGLAPLLRLNENDVQTEADYLSSRLIVARAVRRLNLTESPEFNPYLESPRKGRLQTLIETLGLGDVAAEIKATIATYKQQLGGEEEAAPPPTAEMVFEATVDSVIDGLTVDASAFSRVITITFRSHDPEMTAAVPNALGAVYLEDQRERRRESLQQASQFLTSRVGAARQSVIESEQRLEAFRRANGLVEIGGASLLNQRISDLDDKLLNAQTERAETEARYAQVRRLANTGGDRASLDTVLDSRVVADLRIDESRAAGKVAELEAIYRPEYPELLRAKRDLAEIRQSIQVEIDRQIANLRNSVEIARVRERQLSDALESRQDELEARTDAEVTLRSLQSEVEANRDLYELILNRLKETDVQEGAVHTPLARVISHAVVPQRPFAPRTGIVGLASVLGAGVLALLVAVALEFAIPGFKSARDLEIGTGFPVLASIPRSPEIASGETRLFKMIQERPGALVSHGLRKLRTALTLVNFGRRQRVFMITSSIEGEGKTAISVALAVLAAKSGQRVLIIDADAKKSQVSKELQTRTPFGLARYLAGEVEVEDAMEFDVRTGLYVIGLGGHLDNSEDALASARMEALVDYGRQNFDLVILDAPPVAPVADALVLVTRVDAVVFVVRWESTRRETITQALRELYEVGENIVGLVMSMNDTRVQSIEGRSDNYYYYYGTEPDEADGRPDASRSA